MRISDGSSDVCSSDLGMPFEILFLMRGGRVSPIRDRQDCALIWHSPYISQKKLCRKLMTPSKLNQNELDELMDKAVRKGVAAAILAAQDAGLVKFPVPLFGLQEDRKSTRLNSSR